MPVADVVADHTLVVRPDRGRLGGWTITAGGDVLGRVGEGSVEFDDELLLDLRGERGLTLLVDRARGDRLATIRPLASGPAVISAGSGRYRLSREGLVPFVFEVTADYGGPQVLRFARLGRMLRIRGGADVATIPAGEVALLVAAVAVVSLDVPVRRPAEA